MRRSLDFCDHRNLKDIGFYGRLPSITGDYTKTWDAFCPRCNSNVFAQTGDRNIPWTTNRDYAHSNGPDIKYGTHGLAKHERWDYD